MQGQSLNPQILCPAHPSECLTRIDIDHKAFKQLYCLECVLQTNEDVSLRSCLKSIPEFLDIATHFYSSQANNTPISISKPSEAITSPLSNHQNILDDLTSHISQEKDKIEKYFNNILQELLNFIDEKKRSYLDDLDKKIVNFRDWYARFDRQTDQEKFS